MTSGRAPHGTSSALPPLARMWLATHSAAVTMSAAWPASALTEGIAMNSASWSRSVSDGGATARESSQSGAADRGELRDVAHALGVGESAQLLQALVLDLADAPARDVERATALVERARLLAVEAVAQREHGALALGERPEDG